MYFDRDSHTKYLIDTGSDVSILPSKDFKATSNRAHPTLHAANDTKIRTLGTHLTQVKIGPRKYTWDFIVADVKVAILGADFLSHHKLSVDLSNRLLIDNKTGVKTSAYVTQVDVHTVSTINSNHPYHDLLFEFKDITTPSAMKRTVQGEVFHYIETKGPPLASKSRRMSPDKLAAAKKEFQAMIDLGICQPSSSSWAHPLHAVPKKDGQWRFVGDYRRLNNVTAPDKYPVPHIHDLLNSFYGKKIFTTIDLIRAYHQIPVNPQDVPKTAVITPFGLFEFTRMQFGLCNAGQTFQRFMHSIFSDLDFVVVYIDDICIASKTLEEHNQHIRIVFERLQRHGLVINIDKCVFAQESVEFLGHQISADGVRPLEKRVQAVVNCPQPKTVSELRRFLAWVNVYKRHLPHASHVQMPLRKFLQGNKKNDKTLITWDSESRQAFVKCKELLKNATLLYYPDPSKEMALFVDASNTAAGAALQQKSDEGWQPLGFYSERFIKAVQNYSTFGRELAAMKMSVKYFRHFLEGRQFHIYTDHRPLTTALSSNTDTRLPRELRHLQYISEFTSDIRHISGKDNFVADMMSRIEIMAIQTVIDLHDMSRQQARDEELQSLLKSSKTSLKLEKKLINDSNLALYCDISSGQVRPFVPKEMRRHVIRHFHELSHAGIRATQKLVTQRFVWPKVNKEVREFVKCCLSCQKAKINKHNRSPDQMFEAPSSRFQHIHVDLVGPLPMSDDSKYLLTVVDRYSRWPEAFPLSEMTADTVAKTLYEQWICRYGCPETITTDQGRQFESDLMSELQQFIGSKRIRTCAYHPEANGLVERFHRTIKAAIMARGGTTKWTDQLPTVLLGLRVAFREDLNGSVAEMLFGEPLRIPGEFIDRSNPVTPRNEFVKRLKETVNNTKPIQVKRHGTKKTFINKGMNESSHVFIRVDKVKKPLTPPYEGPFEVVNRFEKFFDVMIRGKLQRISIDRLKPSFMPHDDLKFYPPDDPTIRITPTGHRIRYMA